MYILNTGLGFRLGFAVVARWMDARTRAKFVVFSGGESQVRQDLHHQEGTSPVNAVARETIMERRVQIQSSD